MAEELLNATANNLDGIFLDEHSPGFKNSTGIGASSAKVISGGGIREYEGLRPGDSRLESQYNGDVVEALNVFLGKFKQKGKFLLINTAAYSLHPLAVDQIMAARGVTTELLYTANMNASQFEELIALTKALAPAGGIVDLHGSPCTIMGPKNYTNGYYSTDKARALMWRLAGYYILREPVGSPGTVYLNTNMCIKVDTGIDVSAEWLRAYEADVGQPAGDAVKYRQGASPAQCAGQNVAFTIWRRDYTNAIILVRPKDHWSCEVFDDTSAVTVDLPRPMRILSDDGLSSSPVKSVRLRNADALILLK